MPPTSITYENLANGIVLRAVDDYRVALRDLRVNPSYSDALRTVAEVERFFRSGWFSVLTSVDGVLLLEKLQKECDKK